MDIKKLFYQIAERNGVTVKEVRDEIQNAIFAAYNNTIENDSLIKSYQKRTPCKKGIPTPEDVICFVVREIEKKSTNT